MAWVKIDDQFYDHPKWADAPGDSIALWLCAMAWCNRNDAFDGYIPAAKLGGLFAVKNAKRTCADLVARRAFVPHDNGYLIHGYEEWQQNEKVRAVRAKRSEAGKKGAESRWHGKDMANAIANGSQTDGNPDAPPPTTLVLLTSENNQPSTDTPMAGDFAKQQERTERVLKRYGELLVKEAQAKGKVISDGTLWTERARERERAKTIRLQAEYPTAPDDVLAAALKGETHSLPLFRATS